MPGTPEVAEEIVSMLENEVIVGKIRVLVIDSLTPLLKVFEDYISKRAFLQNNLYTLSKLLNGLGVNTSLLADIEHVSDIVIRLRVEPNKRLTILDSPA